uniref:Uncharacterized protein n=1 Tax=Parascaris univalens TaxID=6257 RepID=A0A915CIA7_PARUN
EIHWWAFSSFTVIACPRCTSTDLVLQRLELLRTHRECRLRPHMRVAPVSQR